MTYIQKIAFHQGIRNEVPNQELAKELAESDNAEGVKEISEYLYDKNKSISSDCIKVLYEVGYLKPALIAEYVDTFLDLITSKVNRMVWGGMIAIATISKLKADLLFPKKELILNTIEKGTLITEVWGIKALVGISSAKDEYKNDILPTLFEFLEKCRPIDFATRTETILPIITNSQDLEVIDRIISQKKTELSTAQVKKLKTIINKHNKNNPDYKLDI